MTAANKPLVSAGAPSAGGQIGERLLDRIGNTPMIRLERTGKEYPNVEILAKAEWFNPGGSVKDRAAYAMIRDGERCGALRPGKVILDATSGNTGIAYAMIGAALGYKVKLCLPSSASPERKQILAAYGVEIVFTPGDEATDGAIRRVREIYQADPEKYFYPDQYSNPANPAAHYATTAPEIWEQTQGRITHFRRRPRYQRHVRRDDAPPQGIEPEDSLHQHAAGFGLSRPRGAEAYAYEPRPRDLRSRRCR